MNKLKVGLIVDDNEHSEMVKYLLNASIESKNFSIETLIVQKTFRTQKSLLKRSCAYVRTRGLKRFMQDIHIASHNWTCSLTSGKNKISDPHFVN